MLSWKLKSQSEKNPNKIENAVLKIEVLMHAPKSILNQPTSSLHLCSPFQQNR